MQGDEGSRGEGDELVREERDTLGARREGGGGDWANEGRRGDIPYTLENAKG